MTDSSIAAEALAYISSHGEVTEMDLGAAVPRLQGKPILAMLQHLIRTGKVAVSYGSQPNLNGGKTYRIFSIPRVEVPNKMNSILRTGPKFGPNAHGGPIREIRAASTAPQDARPRITLPDVARPAAPENLRLPPARKATAPARQPAASAPANPAAPVPAAPVHETPEIWLSGSGRLRIQARSTAVELNASETRDLFRLLSGTVFDGGQNAAE